MAPKDDDKPLELMAETETKMTNNGKNGKDSSKSKSKGGKNNSNGDMIDDANAMSDEDRALKERLETCVSTLINEADEIAVTPAIRLRAIDVIVTELRSATASMTSVPKPLKFLRPKYDILKGYYASIALDESVEGDKELIYLRARLGDVLAVLAMTLGKHGEKSYMYSRHCSILLIVGEYDIFFLNRTSIKNLIPDYLLLPSVPPLRDGYNDDDDDDDAKQRSVSLSTLNSRGQEITTYS